MFSFSTSSIELRQLNFNFNFNFCFFCLSSLIHGNQFTLHLFHLCTHQNSGKNEVNQSIKQTKPFTRTLPSWPSAPRAAAAVRVARQRKWLHGAGSAEQLAQGRPRARDPPDLTCASPWLPSLLPLLLPLWWWWWWPHSWPAFHFQERRSSAWLL